MQPSWIVFAAAFFLVLPPASTRAQQAQPAPSAQSPVRGYLSVEAFELRKEFVLRFDTIAARIGADAVTTIDAANRAGLEKAIGEWLVGKCPVTVDGASIAMEMDRVHFVRPDVEKGLVVEDREALPAAEAQVGVVFAAALNGPPNEVRVMWDVFPADGSSAVVYSGTRGQLSGRELRPANPELIWKNEAALAVPELLTLPPIPVGRWTDALFSLRGIAALGLMLTGIVIVAVKRSRLGLILLSMLTIAAVGLVAKGAVSTPAMEVTPGQADEISYALLRNVYHAFDYRRESDIYDTLAKSTAGDLLSQIYLEVQKSLQVETQGGARVRVTDVDLRKCELAGSEPGKFIADCEWVAVGTVTHWGHTHDRVNKYRAKLSIGPVAGQWRLVALELLSEERVNLSGKK
jgi:hypothetical protein